jgi:hypothetical protein
MIQPPRRDMTKEIREQAEQWDDVPGKVVGHRQPGPRNLEICADFLAWSVQRGVRLKGRPKGVFRYRSHEEANQ